MPLILILRTGGDDGKVCGDVVDCPDSEAVFQAPATVARLRNVKLEALSVRELVILVLSLSLGLPDGDFAER
jgi:hypothetical protein